MEKITVSDWHLSEELETKEDVIAMFEVALEEKETLLFQRL
ncbi:hypothetical protein ACYULU_15290 [Breznakiellaceae bacterium SP9]